MPTAMHSDALVQHQHHAMGQRPMIVGPKECKGGDSGEPVLREHFRVREGEGRGP